MPPTIADLLKEDRAPIRATDATTAVFYSISNCQKGLGRHLLRQLPDQTGGGGSASATSLASTTFVTLSPVPGFADWLSRERQAETSNALSGRRSQAGSRRSTSLIGADQPEIAAAIQPSPYSLRPPGISSGLKQPQRRRQVDPVARFHLGNGARLERINFLGDRSERAMQPGPRADGQLPLQARRHRDEPRGICQPVARSSPHPRSAG